MVGIKHESMRKGQTSHKKEHNTRMCFPLKPVFTRDKGGLPNFIDEPTNGLDPQAIIDLRKKLLDIRNDGTSILLSSHQLSEVDKLVDRIIFIKDGQLIAHKTIDELHQKHISCIKTSDNRYAQKILKDYIVTNDNEYIRLECGSDNDFSKVINLLVENNISIYSIEDKGEGLEKYYQNLYQG